MRLPALSTGRLLRRYKRFLVDVALDSGEQVVAHCPNPGSMQTCCPDQARVWLSRSENPRRKLKYTWELVDAYGALVCVNTARANPVVAEALGLGRIRELAQHTSLKREVPYGTRSRVDFVLQEPSGSCYLEVKNVTLDRGGGLSAFPDAVTQRGARHLEELMAVKQTGARAVLLFLSTRADTLQIEPAREIDPKYAASLSRAQAAGVELLAYRSQVSPQEVTLTAAVPLLLGPNP